MPAPGWYPDPAGGPARRWWDGRDWTDVLEDVAAPTRGTTSAGPPEPAATGRSLEDLPPPGAGVEPPPTVRDDDPGQARPRRRRTGVLATAAAVCLLAAAFLGGAVGGSLLDDVRALADDRDDAVADVVEVRVPAFATAETGARMPDVRGLPEDLAREVLADAVPGADAAVVDYRPWAGDRGTVIEQRPAFGTIDPRGLALTVSEPTVVPDLLGQPLPEAIEELERQGARVEVERRYEQGAATDTVLGLAPGVGSPLPALVRIIASERTSSILLGNLAPVEGRCSGIEVAVDGQRYPDALDCRVGSGTEPLSWLVSRSVQRIEGVVGVRDDGPTDLRLQIEVLVDGESIEQVEVGYGAPAVLDVDVSDALRVTLQVSHVDPDDAPFSSSVILADVRLVGGAAALNTLQGG